MNATRKRIGVRIGALAAVVAVFAWASPGQAEMQGDPSDLAAKLLGVDPDGDPRKLTDPAQIDYAKALGQEVVCLCGTCPRHTVTDCACGWAGLNKRTIQLALLDGKTREEILAAYEKSYGLKVYPEPPDEGLGKLSYALPYLGSVAGLFLLLYFGLRMRRSTPAAATAEPDPKQEAARRILARELDDLD